MIATLRLAQEELEQIETLAGAGYSPAQIAMYLDVPKKEFMKDWNNKDSFIRYHYDRGVLVVDTEHNNWTIDNVNIIHPCPHILYLLKVGFADAGYTLAGDILTDENLGQRWVFSGTQYFINKKIISEEYIVSSTEAYKSDNYYNSSATASNIDTQGTIYYFRKTINFNRIDKYRLDFSFPVSKIESQPFIFEMDVEIKLRGKVIRREERKMRAHVFNIVGEGLKFSFDIDTETTNDELEVHIICKGNYRLNMYGDVMVLKARSMTGFIDEKRATVQDTRIVENPNTIDLTRAVPNMTFSEFVGIIQNWFNYDLKIIDRKVYMNKIGAEEPPEPKDFRVYEISNPKRTLLIEKSYLLKFADLDDGYKLDTMYYDKNGEKLNGFPNKDTSTIEINGYAMPIAKAKEFHTPTAQVKKDSDTTLALVYYDGLREGINNAINPTGCHFPELFYNNWEKWLKQRVISREYQWKFLANIQDISQFSMNDYLFCYQKLHLIKTMNKDKIAPNTYEVEITTETSI